MIETASINKRSEHNRVFKFNVDIALYRTFSCLAKEYFGEHATFIVKHIALLQDKVQNTNSTVVV